MRKSYAMTVRWADIPGPFPGNGSVNTFPLLDSRFLIMQQLDYSTGRAVFTIWSVPRCYKQETRSVESQSYTGVCEERTLAGVTEITIVGAFTRKRLVTD
jgi:hypothetical protein